MIDVSPVLRLAPVTRGGAVHVVGHRHDLQDAIIAAVTAEPGLHTRDLRVSVWGWVSPDEIRRAISAMVRAGLLKRRGRRLWVPG